MQSCMRGEFPGLTPSCGRVASSRKGNPPPHPLARVLVTVFVSCLVRGPDWNWGDQDGGEGVRGDGDGGSGGDGSGAVC